MRNRFYASFFLSQSLSKNNFVFDVMELIFLLSLNHGIYNIVNFFKLLSPMDGVGSPFSCPSSPGDKYYAPIIQPLAQCIWCYPFNVVQNYLWIECHPITNISRFLLRWKECVSHLWQGLRPSLDTQNPPTHPQWRASLQVYYHKLCYKPAGFLE